MHGRGVMAKFALAAYEGGASGIRTSSVSDIISIARKIGHKLPIIGLIKRDYKDSGVYITPTLREVKELIESPCDVIAMDVTSRKRPNGERLEDLVSYCRAHTKKLLMADTADAADCRLADRLGFDYISTTMRSYTEGTKGIAIPDLAYLSSLKDMGLKAELVAEGGIKDLDTLRQIVALGYEYVVIGGAITRPKGITEYYLSAFK
jgi:N-acylglucosamine-6-phosphate 2-epimerase